MVITTKGAYFMDQFHPIFSPLSPQDWASLLDQGCVRTCSYEAGAAIFHRGDRTRVFGILRRGTVHIVHGDVWGNRMILHSIAPGDTFGEVYALCRRPILADVVAAAPCQVILVDLDRLLSPVHQGKAWYAPLLYQLALLSGEKNLAWSQRVLCLSSKHIRTRVMTYLSALAVQQGALELLLPFDRQQLADYLNVERSALSKELGRMQRDGLLTFRKNRFRLNPDARPWDQVLP